MKTWIFLGLVLVGVGSCQGIEQPAGEAKFRPGGAAGVHATKFDGTYYVASSTEGLDKNWKKVLNSETIFLAQVKIDGGKATINIKTADSKGIISNDCDQIEVVADRWGDQGEYSESENADGSTMSATLYSSGTDENSAEILHLTVYGDATVNGKHSSFTIINDEIQATAGGITTRKNHGAVDLVFAGVPDDAYESFQAAVDESGEAVGEVAQAKLKFEELDEAVGEVAQANVRKSYVTTGLMPAADAERLEIGNKTIVGDWTQVFGDGSNCGDSPSEQNYMEHN